MAISTISFFPVHELQRSLFYSKTPPMLDRLVDLQLEARRGGGGGGGEVPPHIGFGFSPGCGPNNPTTFERS